MPTEERARRAREVLAGEFVSRSPGYLDLPSSNLVSVDCAIAAMLTFAAEASGIGVLLKRARWYVADSLDAHEHSDGRDLLNEIDEALAASISSREKIAENANCSPPDIDRSGLAQEVE